MKFPPSPQCLQDFIITDLEKRIMAEGATSADILWWRNLSDEQRDVVKHSEQAQILAATFYFNKTLGMSIEEALREVCKKFIIYHNFPLNQDHFDATRKQGFGPDDYALPWELSARIGKYVTERAVKVKDAEDKKLFQEEVNKFSTANAFFRHKIKNGEIGIINY